MTLGKGCSTTSYLQSSLQALANEEPDENIPPGHRMWPSSGKWRTRWKYCSRSQDVAKFWLMESQMKIFLQINRSADQVDQLISGSKGSRHDLRAYNNDTPVDRARPGKTTRQIGIWPPMGHSSMRRNWENKSWLTQGISKLRCATYSRTPPQSTKGIPNPGITA